MMIMIIGHYVVTRQSMIINELCQVRAMMIMV